MANLTPTAVSKSSNFVTGPSGDRTNDVLTDLLANRTEIYSNMTSIADEFYGATPPANPNVGRKWRCSTTAGSYVADTTYRWNGSAWAVDIAETVSVPQRNCVLEGPVSATGVPILFSAGTGLTVDLKATVRLSFANGFTDDGGASDYFESITADGAAFWSSLPINSTVQIYINRASDGTVTGGYSTLAPVYQNYAPTHSAGLNWFDTNTQKMFVSNGSAWTQVWRVFVGTATTDADSVTTVSVNVNISSEIIKASDIITKGPWVDVRAFGAKGDGATDDTAAIQAAINASKNVFIPSGTYLISASCVWGNSYGFQIIGVRGASILKATADINILECPSADAGQYGTIKGIVFDSATNGVGAGIGKAGDHYLAHTLITECEFTDSLRYGINADLIESDITHNRFGFDGTATTGTKLFKAIKSVGVIGGRETNANRIKYNEFVHSNDDHAIDFQNGFHLTLEGNTLEGNNTTGSLVYTKGLLQNFLIRNWFERNGAIAIWANEVNVQDGIVNVFDGNLVNLISQSAPCAIDVTGAAFKRVSLRNNVFSGTTNLVKNGASYNELSVIADYSNNYVSEAADDYWINGANNNNWFGGFVGIGQDLNVLGQSKALQHITYEATTDLAYNVATTVYTLPNSNFPAMFLVSAFCYGYSVASFSAFAVIATGAAISHVLSNTTGSAVGITMDGLNVKLTQTAGGTIASQIRITRVG